MSLRIYYFLHRLTRVEEIWFPMSEYLNIIKPSSDRELI